MQENKRNIDDFLREELGSYAETPPPAVWEDLEKRLDDARPEKGMPFRRWWWIIPALFFLAGVVFLAAYNIHTRPVQKPGAPVTNNAAAAENPGTAQEMPVRHLPDAKPDTTADNRTAAAVPGPVVKPRKSTPKRTIPANDTAAATGKIPADNNTVAKQHNGRLHNPVPLPGGAAGNAGPAAGERTVSAEAHKPQAQHPGKKSVAHTAPAPVTGNAQHRNTKAARAVTSAADGNKDTGQLAAAPEGNKPPVIVKPVKEGKKKPLKIKPAKNADTGNIAVKADTAITAGKAVAANKGSNKRTGSAYAQASHKKTAPAAPAKKGKKPEKIAAVSKEPAKKKQIARRQIPSAASKPAPVKTAAKQKTPADHTAPPAVASVSQNTSSPVKAPVPQAGSKPAERSTVTGDGSIRIKQDTTADDTSDEMDTDTAEKEREMDPYASLHPPKDKLRPHIEAGIKAAYSYGFTKFAMNKVTAMPYIQLNINTRLSVLLHLGFSYGQMAKTDLSDLQSYYKITGSSLSHTTTLDSIGGQMDTMYHYTYHQSRDSFSTRYSVAKTVWETELPVLLKYRLGGCFSIFGGPVFTWGKIVQITETKSNTSPLQISDTLTSKNIYNQAYFEGRNRPSGLPDSSYASNALQYQNASSSPLRIGYMLGFSYDAGRRLTVDLSLQQMLSNASYIPNPDIRSTYTAPYVRLSLGFKIFK